MKNPHALFGNLSPDTITLHDAIKQKHCACSLHCVRGVPGGPFERVAIFGLDSHNVLCVCGMLSLVRCVCVCVPGVQQFHAACNEATSSQQTATLRFCLLRRRIAACICFRCRCLLNVTSRLHIKRRTSHANNKAALPPARADSRVMTCDASPGLPKAAAADYLFDKGQRIHVAPRSDSYL